MHDIEIANTGALYCLDSQGAVKPLFGRYIVCNGSPSSPDVCTLYVSNSSEREILAFPHNAGMRDVGKPRLFTKIIESNDYPDGLAVDLDGYVWCAHWGSRGRSGFSPNLDFLQFFELPIPRVTSCAF